MWAMLIMKLLRNLSVCACNNIPTTNDGSQSMIYLPAHCFESYEMCGNDCFLRVLMRPDFVDTLEERQIMFQALLNLYNFFMPGKLVDTLFSIAGL